ncbi:MAG TPA: hypothetical protein VH437_13630 [Terriglobales bacterium]
MSALRGEDVDDPKGFGTGAASMSVIGAPIACSAMTGGRLATSRKAMRFMDAPVTIWARFAATAA